MAMQKSLFGAFVDKYFGAVIQKVTERYNGKKELPGYLYEQMLDQEYSADLTWSSTELNNSVVAADVVSMDSSLPLKRRGTIRTASGLIPKIGIKKQMKEKAISDVTVMASKGQKAESIAAKILNNVPKVIAGVRIRLEIMFEQALSTGFVLIDSENNDGTGIRASFGYKDENTFHAKAASWDNVDTATPVSDIRQLFDKAEADGGAIERVYLSKQYFDYAKKSKEVRELVATSLKQTIVNEAYLPVPARQATLDALQEEFNAEFVVVNNAYVWEDAAGNRNTIRPWEQGNVVAVPALKIGRLVYGTLAEDMNRVAGVTYQKSDFILVSEYSHNEPSLAEFTAAQALAMPVIDDGSSIYVLHADAVSPITAEPASLSFTKAADNTGKKVAVHADGDFTASVPSDATWATVSKSGNTVVVKVSANSGDARNTTLTLEDVNGNTATVAIAQAKGN